MDWDSDKDGDCNGDDGGRQATERATKRAMVRATRVAGNKEDNGDGGRSYDDCNVGGG